ncbi:lipopolysaccharide transport periplasmic protein LptA [Luteibacter yeojuensis]|uniref:Lipopolysaccharide transport periplasmic protein LptA n=1 Tax=Luteibacter yeojuensis TaxID=345309 RepID=A0A7X5QX37_9GAMM|nr:lipopolysaccharide transport periplasmic protein LptA [Luteibacter yeojuensis]NID17036.1 lipopolysaccharide transport periplasmic protein LptA [Luteibacter yeojuensis]
MQSTPSTSRASAKAVIAVLCATLLASASVSAKKADRNQPADVTSKSFDGTQAPQNGQPGKVIWTTNVVLTQGTLKITGSKATGYLDADNTLTRVVVDGNPATIHQLDDQDQPMDGRARNIDYKIDQDYAVLTGDAKVNQPAKGSAEGDKLTYNTKDSTMTGESSGSAPVHMTFQPKNKAPAANAPAKPASDDTKKP